MRDQQRGVQQPGPLEGVDDADALPLAQQPVLARRLQAVQTHHDTPLRRGSGGGRHRGRPGLAVRVLEVATKQASEVVAELRDHRAVEAELGVQGVLGLRARVADSPAAVAAAADAVVTVTPATEPLLRAVDLRPGLHVSAVGSPPRPGYREVDAASFAAADLVVVDDRTIAVAESDQVRHAVAAGFDAGRLVELGAVLAGDHTGRTDPDQVTLHSSIGVALQDLAAIRVLLERLGTPVP